MKAYLRAFDLWDVVEIDKQPNPLPENPTLNQIKHHSEEVTKRYKALSCIHSAVSEVMFAKIMACETTKEAWDKLRLEFHGSDKSKQMQIFNLKREFALLRMKDGESIKDYIDRLMKIVNQLTLLGEVISENKVVEQVLVSLPEKFEAKISSLEDSKDISTMTISKLSNSLQAMELRQTFRDGIIISEGAFVANQTTKIHVGSSSNKQQFGKKGKEKKESFDRRQKGKKGRFPPCQHCKKTSHTERYCWYRP
ncbi:uncharacterized protein LOC123218984 [Mangifera indica]|uniref:uncharacterized protein LOC123218984 n=1 Tax=Mangifera indica TaxID=29780 RepID=UPI001CF97F14|nr:uncharacterized protein LOC123218984 [Mangifera indica]